MKSLLGSNTSTSLRYTVHAVVFFLSLMLFVAIWDAVLGPLGAASDPTSMTLPLALTLMSAVLYLGLGTLDAGFFISAGFVLLMGFGQVFPFLTAGGRAGVIATGLGLTLGAAYYLGQTGGELFPARQVPAAQFGYDWY